MREKGGGGGGGCNERGGIIIILYIHFFWAYFGLALALLGVVFACVLACLRACLPTVFRNVEMGEGGEAGGLGEEGGGVAKAGGGMGWGGTAWLEASTQSTQSMYVVVSSILYSSTYLLSLHSSTLSSLPFPPRNVRAAAPGSSCPAIRDPHGLCPCAGRALALAVAPDL